MIRDSIKAAQVAAMKGGDKPRLAAVRLILAKLKDRDIELRTASQVPEDDVLVVEVLQKMVKQRRESVVQFEAGGRTDLADKENAEIVVLSAYLPAQLDAAELDALIQAVMTETAATSVKDMGKVMAIVKGKAAGRADMGAVGARVKALLGG